MRAKILKTQKKQYIGGMKRVVPKSDRSISKKSLVNTEEESITILLDTLYNSLYTIIEIAPKSTNKSELIQSYIIKIIELKNISKDSLKNKLYQIADETFPVPQNNPLKEKYKLLKKIEQKLETQRTVHPFHHRLAPWLFTSEEMELIKLFNITNAARANEVNKKLYEGGIIAETWKLYLANIAADHDDLPEVREEFNKFIKDKKNQINENIDNNFDEAKRLAMSWKDIQLRDWKRKMTLKKGGKKQTRKLSNSKILKLALKNIDQRLRGQVAQKALTKELRRLGYRKSSKIKNQRHRHNRRGKEIWS